MNDDKKPVLAGREEPAFWIDSHMRIYMRNDRPGLVAMYTHPARAAQELLAALQASTHALHTYPNGEQCLCSQCEFVRLRDAAIARATSKGTL